MRQTSERVYGPYYDKDKRRYRVIIHRTDGTRQTCDFESEAIANEAANAARGATQNRMLGQSVDDYLNSIPEKGRITARYRLTAFLKLPAYDRLLRSVSERDASKLYKQRTETMQPVRLCQCGTKGCKRRIDGHTKRYIEEPIRAATHRAELSLARRMFKWCVEQGWIKENPFARVKAIGTPGKGKPKLRVNATRTLVGYLLQDHSLEATAVLTALTLDLRASAVVNRVVEDLDDDGWLLWVRENKSEAGDLEIEVPGFLRARLLELADGKQPADKLFGDVTRDWLHYHTTRLCKVAGVPRVTPHGLRGSGATQNVRAGMGIEEVARSMGHADKGATLKAHYLGGGAIESARGKRVESLVATLDVTEYPIADNEAKAHSAHVTQSERDDVN